MKSDSNSRLVYSSDSGRVGSKHIDKPSSTPEPRDGFVRLRREVKGRGGGTVIVISGLPPAVAAIRELAGILKKKCGSGGTIKGDTIEIQGDHRDTIRGELELRGYKVKLSGG